MTEALRISAQTRLVLTALLDAEWTYGYDLSKATGLKSGTLYPILARLSDAEWLSTKWEAVSGAGRPPRHLYRLTARGRAAARAALTRHSGVARLSYEH